jgi:threonyl-tRNA synthetase
MGFKVREAERAKIPYMLVVGDREVEKNEVSVRRHGGVNAGSMTVEAFLGQLKQEIERREILPSGGNEPVLKGEVPNRSSKAEGQ